MLRGRSEIAPTWVAGLLILFSPWGSQRGFPHVNFKLSIPYLFSKTHKRCMATLNMYPLRGWTVSTHQIVGDLRVIFTSLHLIFVTWVFMVSTDDSHLFPSFPLKSILPLLLLLGAGCHGYRSQLVRLAHDFVYKCFLESIRMFFFSAAKVNTNY